MPEQSFVVAETFAAGLGPGPEPGSAVVVAAAAASTFAAVVAAIAGAEFAGTPGRSVATRGRL